MSHQYDKPYVPVERRTIREIGDHRVINHRLELLCRWHEVDYPSWAAVEIISDPRKKDKIDGYMAGSPRRVLRQGGGFRNQNAARRPRFSTSISNDKSVVIVGLVVRTDGEKVVQFYVEGDRTLYMMTTEDAIAHMPSAYADFMFRQCVEYHVLSACEVREEWFQPGSRRFVIDGIDWLARAFP
ncbi:hypothetical protein Q8F55_006017 [Vanrija albida]|uniref:Chromo domain-containing protein n=1 Tax=Vanrija albida TaxID=181172 RepID=A0ABR3Q3T1_9TREE